MNIPIYNHQTTSLSEIDLRMVRSIPSGGNWKNIPLDIPSKRVEGIRLSGGRTTYYGRLRWDFPAYTIATYFNRPGNGCNIHPDDLSAKYPQHRLISFREAARVQSFPDNFRFLGSKSSMFKQIGNAVPPLLAYSIAKALLGSTVVDLFCGCGGLSKGFELAGYHVLAGLEIEKHALATWTHNHVGAPVLGDINNKDIKDRLIAIVRNSLGGRNLDVLAGGPPCQGFSTAGWRETTDPRNKLWLNYLEILNKLNPKYFLIENVPGLLSVQKNGLLIIDNMRTEFSKLGYFLNYRALKAEDYGVPQLRRRVFIIGNRSDIKPFEFPDVSISTPFTVRDAISNLPRIGVNDGVDELVVTNYQTQSKYQEWLIGECNVESLLSSKPRQPLPKKQLELFGNC
jgi:DNA (cytosine-5)-methyltransferase 1